MRANSEAGQAVVEYIILLAILVSLYASVLTALTNSNILAKIKEPFTKDYKYTYEYGQKDARGQNDGGPINIPQQHDQQYFRIFINPPISK